MIGPDDFPDRPQIAHDNERPIRRGDWLCQCRGCALAAEATAATSPDLPVILKWEQTPRARVTLAAYVAAGCDPYAFPHVEGEHVREVFVGAS